MIEYLSGVVLAKDDSHLVLDVGGVGYGLDISTATSVALPACGAPASVFTYLYVQEQALRLYGFATTDERDLFLMFLGTSGIGPKTALAILSGTTIQSFAQAVITSDLKSLSRLPGIGKKTAERLVVELRDKLKTFAFTPATGQPAGTRPSLSLADENVSDTVEALIQLGCKPLVAERAVAKAVEILGPGQTAETLLREALKHRR